MREFPAETTIRDSYLEQAQLSQTHRWLAAQFSARDGDRAEHGALLAPDPRCKLNGGLVTAETARRVVQSLKIVSLTASGRVPTVRLAATQGAAFEARPSTQLLLTFSGSDPLLPLVDSVSISAPELAGAYPAREAPKDIPHRILALKHRWHALVETPTKTPEPFKDIIGERFVMDWGYGSVSGYDDLAAWLAGSASSVGAARHDIALFEWSELSRDHYRAVFEFDWHGYSLDKQPMRAKSRHTWQVHDRRGERYPRLQRMDVEFLIPFHVATGETA